MSERRKHPRLPVTLTASYVSRGALERDLVTDLSPGGLFLRSPQPLDVGTKVSVEVLVTGEPSMLVAGLVVWKAVDGMGVQFTGILGRLLLELLEKRKESGEEASGPAESTSEKAPEKPPEKH